MAKNAPARFIVLEGIDGAGTTSQMARLLARMRDLDMPVISTAEPSSGAVGRLLRGLLGGACAPFDPRAMALLFCADRRDHLRREIEPHLEAGAHVLCDRYLLSSVVYQGAAGVPRDYIQAIHDGIRPPDLCILIDVPHEVAAQRRAGRSGRAEIYETEDTQRRVAEAYRGEAARLRRAGWRMVTVDGAGTLDEVEALVWQAVGPLVA